MSPHGPGTRTLKLAFALPILVAIGAYIWFLVGPGPNLPAGAAPPVATATVESGFSRTELSSVDNAYLRAELTTEIRRRGQPPESCEGWTVVVQTRDPWFGETTRHSEPCNAEGIAEFTLPGSGKIDWVACLPPAGSGLALGYQHFGSKLQEGANHLSLLFMRSPRSATGRVIAASGDNVEGVVVHAHPFNHRPSLSDWTPGLLTATVGADGRFQINQIPDGLWAASVEPTKWFVMNPRPQQQHNLDGLITYSKKIESWDFGYLQVVPFSPSALHIRDQNQRPAGGVEGWIELLQLHDSLPENHPHANEYHFPFKRVPFRTNHSGNVTLHIPHGLWRLHITPPQGLHADLDFPTLDFYANNGSAKPTIYTIPARLGDMKGRIILDSGAPGSFANLSLRFTSESSVDHAVEMVADSRGFFEFHNLELNQDYTLRAVMDKHHARFVGHEWQVEADTFAQEKEFRVEEGLETSVVAVHADWNFQKSKVALRARRWIPTPGDDRGVCVCWWQAIETTLHRVGEDPIDLPRLPEGSIEYSVLILKPTGDWNSFGVPLVDWAETSRVVIQTGLANQEIELDLEQYPVPPKSATKHTGRVVDFQTGKPIEGAHIHLQNLSGRIGDSTNRDGHFSLTSRSGPATIWISAYGFCTLEIPLTDYPIGEQTHELQLLPDNQADPR